MSFPAFRGLYAAAPESLHPALRDLSAYLLSQGLGAATRMRVASAAGELVDNACRHAYPGTVSAEAPRPFELTAQVEEDSVRVRVRDQGIGFNALDAFAPALPSGSCPENGLSRASSLAEDMTIEPCGPEGGSSVTLDFQRLPVGFHEQGAIDLDEIDYLDPSTAKKVLAALADGPSDDLHIPSRLAVTIGRLLGTSPADLDTGAAL